jgi:hypothetical protein
MVRAQHVAMAGRPHRRAGEADLGDVGVIDEALAGFRPRAHRR